MILEALHDNELKTLKSEEQRTWEFAHNQFRQTPGADRLDEDAAEWLGEKDLDDKINWLAHTHQGLINSGRKKDLGHTHRMEDTSFHPSHRGPSCFRENQRRKAMDLPNRKVAYTVEYISKSLHITEGVGNFQALLKLIHNVLRYGGHDMARLKGLKREMLALFTGKVTELPIRRSKWKFALIVRANQKTKENHSMRVVPPGTAPPPPPSTVQFTPPSSAQLAQGRAFTHPKFGKGVAYLYDLDREMVKVVWDDPIKGRHGWIDADKALVKKSRDQRSQFTSSLPMR